MFNVIIAIAICVTVGLSFNSYLENGKEKVAAENGLEQCPKHIGAAGVIWVKSCKTHLETVAKIEKDK